MFFGIKRTNNKIRSELNLVKVFVINFFLTDR